MVGVARALVAGQWVRGDVAVDDGRIDAVGVRPGGIGIAIPGFVDRQVNGFGGVDLRYADAERLAAAGVALAGTGVVAYLPTIASTGFDDSLESLGAIGAATVSPPPGARPLGAHLEGPFLSASWAGAHDGDRLSPVNTSRLERLLAAGPVRIVTLAPELIGADALIERLVADDVIVSMGHTDADAETASGAVALGVSMITHCFNAHRRFAARDPGPAGVALSDARVTVGLIADLLHVAPEVVRLCFAAAGRRVAVVTDAVAPAGTAATTWDFDGVPVTVRDGRATLADGTLSGSVVSMSQSLRNLLMIGIDPALAVHAVSTGPAAGLLDGPHDLSPGSPAAIAVLDEDWSVRGTV
jgi:N-acetylglucosamine-6-phosphate deacetylase